MISKQGELVLAQKTLLFWATRQTRTLENKNSNNMTIEKDKLVAGEATVAEVMNNYSVNISQDLTFEDPPETNMDNIGSDIIHSFEIMYASVKKQ